MLYHKTLPIIALVSACISAAPDDDVLDPQTPEATATAAVTAVPAFRSISTRTNGTTISRPAGLAAGDFLLAALEYDAHPVMLTPPPGWALIADQISNDSPEQVFHALVYTHVATASEPAQYTFAAPAGVYVDIQIADYTGVTTVDKVAGVGMITDTIPAPNLTTSQPNELLVSVFIDFEFGSWTTAAGMTQRSNFDANSLQDMLLPAAGATGKRLASCTRAAQAAINIALK